MAKFDFSDTTIGSNLLPDGEYHVLVTDAEVRQTGENSKHPDSDYWNLEVTVQDGEYEGQRDWINVMLPPYEMFTLGNLLVALGFDKQDVKAGKIDVELEEDDLDNPDDEYSVALIGQEFIMRVKTKIKKGNENRSHSFKAYDPETWSPTDGDVLP